LWAKQVDLFVLNLIFAPQKYAMTTSQQEYQEELKKVQDRDFTHSWVSSSAFLFYLQVFCVVALIFGSCYMLYTKRFHKPEVTVQESSQYTPKYK
jgi:hypothetical protein